MKENRKVAVLDRPVVAMGENLVVKRTKEVRRYQIMLRGVTPLLTDPMGEDVLNSLRTGEKLHIDKTRSLEQICEGKLYLDDSGEITIPAANVLAALNFAGTFFSYPGGKKQLATEKKSLIPSFLDIEGEYLKFSSDGWQPDQRRGRLANGTAVAVVRPKFKNWSVEFNIRLDNNEPIKIDTVIGVFEKAGKASGLGSFRPSCSGNFGKFDIESCIEIPLD